VTRLMVAHQQPGAARGPATPRDPACWPKHPLPPHATGFSRRC
jgi:hypothetical protein